jgi:hypothetical protein
MFLIASLLSEHSDTRKNGSLPCQIGQQSVDFFMKGVGVVPNGFSGRPKTAEHGAPNCRFGFSYSDLRAVHPKPVLQSSVPGPFKTVQVGFTAPRNAFWNKPISFNSATMAQRANGTYAASEPRFETLLTRMPHANTHFAQGQGLGLTPYKWQLRQPCKVPYNCIRPALFEEEFYEQKTHEHAKPGKLCSEFLSSLQSKRSREYQAAPKKPKVQKSIPLFRKPWRLMIPHESDTAMATLMNMAVLAHGNVSRRALSAPPQRA